MTTQTQSSNFVQQNLPWNFTVNLIDIAFITFGLSLISRETVIPVLVSRLTDSSVAIGLITASFYLGYNVPQLFFASYSETLHRQLPFVAVIGGLMERVPYLFIGLAVMFFATSNPTMTLVLLLLGLATTAAGAGVATPAWFTMIGKVLPVNRRGIFFGVSGGLGAFAGIAGAQFVGWMLDTQPYPANFGWVFIIAFIFTAISWVGLVLNREPESPTVKKPVPLISYLRQLPQVMGENHNYRRYLISYSVSRFAALTAIGFFTVYGDDTFGLTGEQIGWLTGILIGAKALLGPAWGWLADRSGYKIVLIVSALTAAVAAVVAIMASGFVGLVIAFVFLGASISTDDVAKLSIILEFAESEDHPTFIGLTNTLLAPVTVVAPLIGGVMVGRLDYGPMFMFSAGVAILATLMFIFWVHEPRTANIKLKNEHTKDSE